MRRKEGAKVIEVWGNVETEVGNAAEKAAGWGAIRSLVTFQDVCTFIISLISYVSRVRPALNVSLKNALPLFGAAKFHEPNLCLGFLQQQQGTHPKVLHSSQATRSLPKD